MIEKISIGGVLIDRTASLAPMAGVADRAFRQLCKSFGASYLIGEMASSKGLLFNSKKTEELLAVSAEEHPIAIQLFGNEPDTMARAAVLAMSDNPDVLDINMGCPAPKVNSCGGGSSLMRDPKLAGKIVKAVSSAVNIPVTVKFRKGWDDLSVNAVEFAKICEENGAAALTVHGRTRMQMYAPPVDRDIIRKVKQAVSVPVIANGDVTDVESCISMYEDTGCDLVMIGRGALGKPWVFSQIDSFFRNGTVPPEPKLPERMEILKNHVEAICKYKGERIGMREARKHAAWYIKGFHGAASLRSCASTLSSLDDLYRFIDLVLK